MSVTSSVNHCLITNAIDKRHWNAPSPRLSITCMFPYNGQFVPSQIAKLYGPHLGLMWSYLGWYVGPIWPAHMVYVWGIWAPLGPNGTRVGFAPYTPYGHHMGQKGLVWAISGPRDMNPTLIPYNPSGAHTLPRSWYQMGPRWVMSGQYGMAQMGPMSVLHRTPHTGTTWDKRVWYGLYLGHETWIPH